MIKNDNLSNNSKNRKDLKELDLEIRSINDKNDINSFLNTDNLNSTLQNNSFLDDFKSKDLNSNEDILFKESIFNHISKIDNNDENNNTNDINANSSENIKNRRKSNLEPNIDLKKTDNRVLSKWSPFVYGNKLSNQQKRRGGVTKKSPTKDIHDIRQFSQNNRTYTKKDNIIKFKKKKENDLSNYDNENGDELDFEDDIPFEKRKSLPNKLRKQFEKIKIEGLKKIENIENYVDDKFVRDKSNITVQLEMLNKEIKKEKTTKKDQLAANIIEDIEKQESWQSYTTLLFAEVEFREKNEGKS